MRYLCVVLLSIGCLMGIQYIEKDDDIYLGPFVILSVIDYFMCYVLVSGFLFWINFYSIKKAAVLTFLIVFSLFVYMIKRSGIHTKKIYSGIKSVYMSLIVVFVLAIFNRGNFGYFGMGQDQGVYQVEAVNLYYNIPMKGVIVDEYDELPEGKYKDYYLDMVMRGMEGGYDLLKNSTYVPGVSTKKISSQAEGLWHGIPTYPSILALTAKIFGIENMHVLGTIFFICLLCITEFILDRSGVHKIVRALSIVLLGLSPEVIWIKKSTLTEGFLAVLVVTYLYYMSASNKKEWKKSVFPVVTYCYFHVSAFTMMPIFVINYWLMYFRTKDKGYLKCAQIIIAGYVSGFFMMWTVQPRYTLLNYRGAVKIVPLNMFIPLVILAGIVSWTLTHYLAKRGNKINFNDKQITSVIKYVCAAGALFILGFALYNQYSTQDFIMQTLICYAVLSGVVLLPVLFIEILKNRYELDNKLLVVLTMFTWCIIIYSAVMKRNVQFYYYYSRYLMPFISIIIILFALLIRRYYYQVLCLLVGIILMLPYAETLRVNKDDTRMQWSCLTDIIHSADGATAVLLDQDLGFALYYPLKASIKAKVYPVPDTYEETLKYIPESNLSKLIYISSREIEDSNDWMKLIYRNTTIYELDDNVSNRSTWSGLVKDINNEGEYEVTVYQSRDETGRMEAADQTADTAFISGWSPVNTLGFRWTAAGEAKIRCYLKEDDYTMKIVTGDTMPLEALSINSIKVEVFVNGQYINEYEYTEDNIHEDWEIQIDKKFVNDGYNEVSFKSNMWSPAECGSRDQNHYGFSVDYIQMLREGEADITSDMKAKIPSAFLSDKNA